MIARIWMQEREWNLSYLPKRSWFFPGSSTQTILCSRQLKRSSINTPQNPDGICLPWVRQINTDSPMAAWTHTPRTRSALAFQHKICTKAHIQKCRETNKALKLYLSTLAISEQTFRALKQIQTVPVLCTPNWHRLLFFPPENETMSAVMAWSYYETFHLCNVRFQCSLSVLYHSRSKFFSLCYVWSTGSCYIVPAWASPTRPSTAMLRVKRRKPAHFPSSVGWSVCICVFVCVFVFGWE